MFYGREYSAEQLREFYGSPGQIARIASTELRDGKEKGVHCLDFRTGSGLNFTVVPDRCMDIAFVDFRGINLSWMSPASIVAPQYYEPNDWGWLRGFFGGMLTTCGLVNVGIPDEYMGEPMGGHGRIAYTPATNVSYDAQWIGEQYYLLARGEMRETRPMGYNLLLRRRIKAIAGETCFHLHDTVINEGPLRVPHQILYHINVGFPILSSASYLLTPSRVVTPRDQEAEDAREHYKECAAPTKNYMEKVYYHSLLPCTDGRNWAAIINPELNLGVYVKYEGEDLPILGQWKMMRSGTYVMGIEPSNSYGIGMGKQNSLGLLKSIEAGQEIDYRLEIGVLANEYEIEAFEREVSVIMPGQPQFASILV